MSDQHERATEREARRPWEAPTLTEVGTLGEVLEGGGGKLSVPTDDMGDVRKPTGQE